MSVKHVKKYYHQVEKMYFELLADLKEMEKDFKAGDCTEEELQKLLTPVENIKQNYERLAYVMYLLYQPNKDRKKSKYDKANKGLYGYFQNSGFTAEQELQNERDALKLFKEQLKERKKQ